jgi:hypothetical protein
MFGNGLILNTIVPILVMVAMLYAICWITGIKFEKLMETLRTGLPQEYLTFEGRICLVFAGILIFFIIFREALSFVLIWIVPDREKSYIIHHFVDSIYLLIGSVLFVFFVNVLFLGFTKKD